MNLIQSIAVLAALSLFLACSASKKQNKVPSYLENAFELKLAEKMDPMRIQNGFDKYNLKYECTLDKAQNICVFSFSSEISQDKIISIFSQEVGVESASKTKGCNQ